MPHIPPARPPPLLDESDIACLCRTGYLSLALPASLEEGYTRLFEVSESFFSLPHGHKQSLFPHPPETTEEGYFAIAGEKEYLTFRWAPALFTQQVSAVWRETATLLYRVLADISSHLAIPLDAWDALLDGCLSLPSNKHDATSSLLRLFRYNAKHGGADRHRDLGLLTLCVARDGVGGLEVTDGIADEWLPAPRVTLLAGDLLRLLSLGRVAAGVHRVVPVDDAGGRFSAVFALRIATRHAFDSRPFGGEEIVESRVLWDRVKAGRTNVNAPMALRNDSPVQGKSGVDERGIA